MKSKCPRCGGELVTGQVRPTAVERQAVDDPKLAFVATRGTRSSWNPIKAIFQGMRRESEYREETFALRAVACAGCGAVELFLGEEDLAQLTKWLDG